MRKYEKVKQKQEHLSTTRRKRTVLYLGREEARIEKRPLSKFNVERMEIIDGIRN